MEILGTQFVAANQHILDIKLHEQSQFHCTYVSKGQILTSILTLHAVQQSGDLLLCKLFNKSGTKEVSPFLSPLPIRFVNKFRGLVVASLVGCDVCRKPTSTDLVDLNTCRYKVNTVDGDCGRPVVFHDRYRSQCGTFYFLGVHRWYYPSERLNGFEPAFFRREEGIVYFATLPGAASNPGSEYIRDDFAKKYYDEFFDSSVYEIKKINRDIATEAVSKYDNPDWMFSDLEVVKEVKRFMKVEFEYALQGFANPFTNKEEFLEACKRAGDGSLNHTSSGFPWSKVFADKVEAINQIGDDLWDSIHSGEIEEIPAIFSLFLKDEVRAINKSCRSILSSPLHHLVGCVFLMHDFHTRNLQRAADPSYLSSLGIDVLKEMGPMWKKMFSKTTFGGSFDVDAMDTTISKTVLGHIMAMWKENVPLRWHSLFDKLMAEVIFTPMRLADGTLWIKSGGNPTGWYGTGDLNTWASVFYFYYAVGVWLKKNRPQTWCTSPVLAMKSFVVSKHNGDDTLYAFSTNVFMTKADFEEAWEGYVKVTWDDPLTDYSHSLDCTFLSMKPVPVEDRWRTYELGEQLMHCKISRPLTKMYYRKKRHSFLVMYEKTVSLLTLVWFSRLWSARLLEIKSSLEKEFPKINSFPSTLIPILRGEAVEENDCNWVVPTYLIHRIFMLPRQQGRRSPMKMSKKLVTIPEEEYYNLQRKYRNREQAPSVASKKKQKGQQTYVGKTKQNRYKPPKSKGAISNNNNNVYNPNVVRKKKKPSKGEVMQSRQSVTMGSGVGPQPTLTIPKFSNQHSVIGAYMNLSKQVLDTAYPAPINTVNRRIAAVSIPFNSTVMDNGKTPTGTYGDGRFSKMVILNGSVRAPTWFGSHLADGTPFIKSAGLNNPPNPESIGITLPTSKTAVSLWGLLVRTDLASATISSWYTQIQKHGWMLKLQSQTPMSPSFDFHLTGTEATIEVGVYSANFTILAAGNLRAGDPFVWAGLNATEDVIITLTLISDVSETHDAVIYSELTNATLVTSADLPEYKTAEAVNFIPDSNSTTTVTYLSHESRLVRTLGVFTDVEALNTLNGTVTQAFVFGTTAPQLSWEQFLIQSPTSRQSALAKGFDMFWVAQTGEYDWSDKWSLNPFLNPSSTPSVAYVTANYVTTSIQVQTKLYYWVEYCSQNPALPTNFVLDSSSEWLQAISAFSAYFRYSANFDHRSVLRGISTMAAWVLSGEPEAVALRRAILSGAKVAGGAALALL